MECLLTGKNIFSKISVLLLVIISGSPNNFVPTDVLADKSVQSEELGIYLELKKSYGNSSLIFRPLSDYYEFFKLKVFIENPNSEIVPIIHVMAKGLFVQSSDSIITNNSQAFSTLETNLNSEYLNESRLLTGSFPKYSIFGLYGEYNLSSSVSHLSTVVIKISAIFAHSEKDIDLRESGDYGYSTSNVMIPFLFFIPLTAIFRIKKRSSYC